jgi:hypothetical protein
MNYKYLLIEYDGDYPIIKTFLESKAFHVDIKRSLYNRLFAKVPDGVFEEFMNLNNHELKGVEPSVKITKVEEIPENEYIFGKEGSDIMSPTAKSTVSCPLDNSKIHSVQDNINNAFMDAILPSKSPLPPDDPFAYLCSGKYMFLVTMLTVNLLFIRIFP